MTTERDTGKEAEADYDSALSSQRPQWGVWLRNIALGIAVLVTLWLVVNVRLPTLDELQSQINHYGGFAWFAFVLLYAVVAVTPIPVTVMAVTAGLLFGVVEGSVLSVIGVLIGCWIAYWLARGLGKTTVKRLLGRHASTVEKRLESAGLEAVFTLRLMPGLPYWPVNYGSGAFGVSQRDYLVASSLATIPGQVSLVAIGSFVASPSILHASIVVSAWIVVVTLTILSFRRLRKTAQG
ncbi:MAG: TVP38/TMEM64 family protein [Canibacter sp.]